MKIKIHHLVYKLCFGSILMMVQVNVNIPNIKLPHTLMMSGKTDMLFSLNIGVKKAKAAIKTSTGSGCYGSDLECNSLIYNHELKWSGGAGGSWFGRMLGVGKSTGGAWTVEGCKATNIALGERAKTLIYANHSVAGGLCAGSGIANETKGSLGKIIQVASYLCASGMAWRATSLIQEVNNQVEQENLDVCKN